MAQPHVSLIGVRLDPPVKPGDDVAQPHVSLIGARLAPPVKPRDDVAVIVVRENPQEYVITS